METDKNIEAAGPARLLLVEGVPGTGKSTLISSLMRAYVGSNRRVRSLLHLTQSHTYFPLAPDEPGVAAGPARNVAHLESIVGLLEWLVSSVSYEERKIFFCAIDTLHVTHCFRPGALGWDDVSSFDRRLSQLGCRLVFLRAAGETIWERTILARKDNEFITRYGRRYGDGLEGIHEYFVKEQEKMLSLVEKSAMDKLILDCDAPPDVLSREVFEYWVG